MESTHTARAILSRRSERAIVVAMGVLHLVLAIGFGLGPILEGSGDIGHYNYVRFGMMLSASHPE